MKNVILTIFVVSILLVGTFFIGFFIGEKHEQDKYTFIMQGDNWQIRYRGQQPEWLENGKNQNTNVKVWPFVDIETKSKP